MAGATDILMRLLFDTKGYEANLAKAKTSLKDFSSGNQALSGVLDMAKGAVSKLAAGIGVAMTAAEAFNKTINSSQTLADGYQRVLHSATTVVNNFFTAIANADFSVINQGLSEMISKAADAANAVDQLGNTLMSYNVLKSRASTTFNQAMDTYRDPNTTEEQKREAKKVMEESINELKDATAVLNKDILATIQTSLAEKSALEASDFDQNLIRTILEADVKNNRDQLKAEWSDQIKQWQKERKAVDDQWEKNVGDYNVRTNKSYKEARERDRRKVDLKYLQAVTANQLLEKYDDPALESLGQQMIQRDQNENYIYGLNRMLYRAENGLNKTTTPKTTPKTTRPKNNTTEQITTEQKAEIETWKALADNINDQRKRMAQMYKDNVESLSRNDYEEVEDEGSFDSSGLEKKQKTYELAMDKIQEYKELMDVANSEENTALQEQVSLWEGIAEAMNPAYKKMKEMQELQDKETEYVKNLGNVAEGFHGIAEAFGSVDDEGFQVISKAALMAEAVAVMISKLKTSVTVWDYIAGIGAGMAAIITAFKGLSFAEGGIVPGANYQDGITARVSSGEMIMNEHDQKQLYDSIHSGSLGGGQSSLRCHGEELVTVINNLGMRKGWGRIKFE